MVFPIKYQQKNFKKTSTYYQRSALHALFDENELKYDIWLIEVL